MLRVLTAADTLKRSPRLPGAEGSHTTQCQTTMLCARGHGRGVLQAQDARLGMGNDGRRSWRVEVVVADPGHACASSTRACQGWSGWACSRAEASQLRAARSR